MSKTRRVSKKAKTTGAARKGYLATAISKRRTVKERVAAMAAAPLPVPENEDSLKATLNILRDKDEPIEVRLAALQALQAASFSVVAFEAARGDYIATLRQVAEDPNHEMRQRVLGMLAREKDGFAQKRLLEGLQHPEKALLPPEKALQLLSYDVHSDAYPVARAIVAKPPNPAAKREALRLLAADATSAPLFEKVLRDKKEEPAIRQTAAAALHAVRPDRYHKQVREMLLDSSENEDLHAVALTALTNFGDAESITKDKALLKRVARMSGEARPSVKKIARHFMNKYSA